jgi:hypothetical protein
MTEEDSNVIRNHVARIWKTKGSRFNAYWRIKYIDVLSIFIVSMLSSYVIVLSLIPTFFSQSLTVLENQICNFGSVVISIFIIVLSLIEFSSGRSIKAEEMHRSALEIAKISAQLDLLVNTSSADLEKATSLILEYENLVSSCSCNHNVIDYKRFKASHPNDFNLIGAKGIFLRFLYVLQYNLQPSVLYIILLFSPAIMILLLLWQKGVL